MRKAIVIGIILSIAVLIAVVFYIYNTKMEGFEASNSLFLDKINLAEAETLEGGKRYFVRFNSDFATNTYLGDVIIEESLKIDRPVNSARMVYPQYNSIKGGWTIWLNPIGSNPNLILSRDSEYVKFRNSNSGHLNKDYSLWKQTSDGGLSTLENSPIYHRSDNNNTSADPTDWKNGGRSITKFEFIDVDKILTGIIDKLNSDVLAVEEKAAIKIAEAEEKIKQAMENSPDKKYVKSKVKISPDIQKYINEELAKYSDKNSLPTVTQLEQLKKLSTDNSAEKLASIPGLLKKFSDNTQSYMDFHNSYEDQLKEILETKFDAEKRANIEIQKRNATRLNRLQSEITNYANVNKINLTKEGIEADTSKAGTLRNIGDGTMLNFDKTNDNKHVVLKMSGEKMIMQDGELKKDANGEVQGCLTFDSSKNRLGTPALTCCNINNSQSPELSFRVSKINNKDEYNKLLTKISPETKSLATDYDTINYPFSVVEPQLSPGYCVSVEDQKVRILPCEKDSNQRYRKLNYQVKKNCGLN